MKKVCPFLFFIGLILIQVTILDNFKFFYVKPDLVLIAAVAFCFYFDFRLALLFSLWAGFLKDAFSLAQFGTNIVLFPFLIFLILRLIRKIVIEINYLYSALIFLVTLSHGLLSKLFFSFSGDYIPWITTLRIVFLVSMYNALISPILFQTSRRLSDYLKT